MIRHFIQQRVQEATRKLMPDAEFSASSVVPCADARFGDYQWNGVMGLAKERGLNPRQLAAELAPRIAVAEWCGAVELAGAGFLNCRVNPEALSAVLAESVCRGELLLEPNPSPRRVVVDFSSPNVAKAMHVGHIRSTILGDCLARVLRLLGHTVVTDNHLGDWGTQFGKLILGWKTRLDGEALSRDPLEEMERLYRLVNADSERDPGVMEAARAELVKLQRGDAENRRLWERMTEVSRGEFERVYARLGVRFDHTLGESFYNPRLEDVLHRLVERGIARESEGALVIFFEEADLAEHPAIVRKSDGAANYATTDLATLEYRWETWRPDEILYVTDGRQQLHFRQMFQAFRRWHPEASVRLHHIWFGSILGEDGKPFRTRSGATIRLTDLLDEAEERAYGVVTEKNGALDAEQRREIARIVGIGAVKYADLLPNRQTDYVFSWDRMLALNGNTAPYLQYAYTRVRSILRKGEVGEDWAPPADLSVPSAPEELALAKHLVNFGWVLKAVASEHRPNHLCNYLYELAGRFARFFERCPVLRSEGPERNLRLLLCLSTERHLREGLRALGIETSERM